MLLETHPTPDTVLYIDTPSAAGFDKASQGADDGFHPDHVVQNVCTVAVQVLSQLGEAVAEIRTSNGGPDVVDLNFTIRVDGSAKVCVAQNRDQGQFQVLARWTAPDTQDASRQRTMPPAASNLFGKPG